jgi:hypothetical protein
MSDSKGNGKPKIGRPLKDIDRQKVFKLAKIGCTLREMGDILDCDPTTLTNRFSTEISLGRGVMKKSLRRRQLKIAHNGNAQMAIWLGKQMLGQKDKVEVSEAIAQPEDIYTDPLAERVAAKPPTQGGNGNGEG